MKTLHSTQSTHTIVIGGGQAGLAVGYHLAQQGIPSLILDANQKVGDAWRNRWDSLRLFNPGGTRDFPDCGSQAGGMASRQSSKSPTISNARYSASSFR